MQSHQLILFIFFLTAFQYCKKPGCFDSAGSNKLIERKVGSFHQIDLADDINLIITQDTAEWLKVEAGENIHPNIITQVEKGVLIIKNNTNCKWLRDPAGKINVFVGVKNLDYVSYNGSGDIRSTNTIIANDITFYSKEGAGNIDVSLDAQKTTATILYENADFTFAGKSDVCYTYVNSRGSIDFKNFEVRHMNIGYASVRDAVINVSGALESLVYHTGNLYYKGNPSYISTHSYSSGKIIHLK